MEYEYTVANPAVTVVSSVLILVLMEYEYTTIKKIFIMEAKVLILVLMEYEYTSQYGNSVQFTMS